MKLTREHGVIAAYIIMTELSNRHLRYRLARREKQVTYLIDMINKGGGVTDEFDKVALTDLGLEIHPNQD